LFWIAGPETLWNDAGWFAMGAGAARGEPLRFLSRAGFAFERLLPVRQASHRAAAAVEQLLNDHPRKRLGYPQGAGVYCSFP